MPFEFLIPALALTSPPLTFVALVLLLSATEPLIAASPPTLTVEFPRRAPSITSPLLLAVATPVVVLASAVVLRVVSALSATSALRF